MKNTAAAVAGMVLIAALGGCATVGSGRHYAALAKEYPFEYFFPAPGVSRDFDTLGEAYEYVKTAQAKFAAAAAKPQVKGLAAKLSGPATEGDRPVTLNYFMSASNERGVVELSGGGRSLEETLRNEVSALVVFLVFYEGRGVSIPGYHLRDHYHYLEGNAHFPSFTFNGIEYAAEYPVNWNTETAFKYLGKEID
jgi:hypothetical protein